MIKSDGYKMCTTVNFPFLFKTDTIFLSNSNQIYQYPPCGVLEKQNIKYKRKLMFFRTFETYILENKISA